MTATSSARVGRRSNGGNDEERRPGRRRLSFANLEGNVADLKAKLAAAEAAYDERRARLAGFIGAELLSETEKSTTQAVWREWLGTLLARTASAAEQELLADFLESLSTKGDN